MTTRLASRRTRTAHSRYSASATPPPLQFPAPVELHRHLGRSAWRGLALAWTTSCLNLVTALVAATKYPGCAVAEVAYCERWDSSEWPIDLVGCGGERPRAASWTTRAQR